VTTPKQARKSSDDGPRVYSWPPNPPHELEVISVTSAIKGGLPKEYLIGWAAKMSSECAVDKHDLVSQMIAAGEQRAAVSFLKEARFRDMRAKGDRGTIVHAAIEAYIDGKPLSNADIEAKLDEARVTEPGLRKATVPMVNAVLSFLQDAEPEIVWSEHTVYSRTYEYAGTADIIGRMHIGGSRLPVVIDIKTSKSIYDEVALQLAAYARADFVGLDDGTEVPLFIDGEVPEYGVVVRPMASGKYETATFALTDDVFKLFLSCLTTARLDGVQSRARRPS
jgi:hypothetical protein